MRTTWLAAGLAVLGLLSPARAEQPSGKAPPSFQVPYRLTVPKHLLVRAKINGKGPFNFILDTGAPALFVSTALCKKLEIEPDRTGWGTFDRFEVEGGVVLTRVRGRVEDPFQLEGMNGLGLAGAELHGIIGYNILARYRIEIDFTRDKLVWTPLNFKPPGPGGLGGKAGGGGLDAMGTIMKMVGSFLGKKANPDVTRRGFLGVELEDGEESPAVKAVLGGGPADKGGLRPGDRLTHFQGRTVLNTEDVQRLARKMVPGDPVKLTVRRGKETLELSFAMGEGL